MTAYPSDLTDLEWSMLEKETLSDLVELSETEFFWQ
jgi:hypothetical protein